jgi:hypothetical protein
LQRCQIAICRGTASTLGAIVPTPPGQLPRHKIIHPVLRSVPARGWGRGQRVAALRSDLSSMSLLPTQTKRSDHAGWVSTADLAVLISLFPLRVFLSIPSSVYLYISLCPILFWSLILPSFPPFSCLFLSFVFMCIYFLSRHPASFSFLLTYCLTSFPSSLSSFPFATSCFPQNKCDECFLVLTYKTFCV